MKRKMTPCRQLIWQLTICSLLTVFCLSGCQPAKESPQGTDPASGSQQAGQNSPPIEKKPDDPERIAQIEEIGGEVQKDDAGAETHP